MIWEREKANSMDSLIMNLTRAAAAAAAAAQQTSGGSRLAASFSFGSVFGYLEKV